MTYPGLDLVLRLNSLHVRCRKTVSLSLISKEGISIFNSLIDGNDDFNDFFFGRVVAVVVVVNIVFGVFILRYNRSLPFILLYDVVGPAAV